MTNKQEHIFDRSGLAAQSDLQTHDWHQLFEILEGKQAIFLEKESFFRSPNYKWPRDALHTWSRVWEYPYVYYHLKNWKSNFKKNKLPRVVDFGSGVTFFPMTIAQLGCHVTCVDIDPVCQRDLLKAIEYVPIATGKVDFKLIEGNILPIGDGEAEVVYCISVLEHLPHFNSIIFEIARILEPRGLFLLTVDLGMGGDAGFDDINYKKLVFFLRKYFDFKYPEVTVHPADLLLSQRGSYPMIPLNGFQSLWFIIKQWIVKPFLGRKPIRLKQLNLAVQGFALEKKPSYL